MRTKAHCFAISRESTALWVMQEPFEGNIGDGYKINLGSIHGRCSGWILAFNMFHRRKWRKRGNRVLSFVWMLMSPCSGYKERAEASCHGQRVKHC